MGASAIAAANSLNSAYGVPFSKIMLTPMIGGNDTPQTFTLADVGTVSSYALSKGLAGVHFWSFDRDRDCAPGSASATCNTYGVAGTLGFTNEFITRLGL
jgi:chitinase